MTTTIAAPGLTTGPTRTDQGWLRRHRAVLLISSGLVAATVLTAVSTGSGRYTDPLDPANANPDGARAIAKVLGHQGIDVQVVRSAKELAGATTDLGTTVVVTSTGSLGRGTIQQLRDQASDALVVLVDPDVGIPTLFDAQEGIRTRRSTSITAHCNDPLFDGLTLKVDQYTSYPSPSNTCFAHAGGSVLGQAQPLLVMLGAGGLLANDQIARADNAAFALRLLGQHNHLVWYVPDAADNSAHDSVGISSILPRWLKPGLWLLGICVLALMIARGRRLGALVTEPLPVVVTAIETTRSRGRLYRKVNDRAYAADALRRAARRRLAVDLNLPRSAVNDPQALVTDIAAATGIDSTRLRGLLLGDGVGPRTDKDLTDLANALADLTREVRRP
ncbi:MAG: secreted protein [Marmoricola sp.]|nr:secreted protein [Marmoricola sp.]